MSNRIVFDGWIEVICGPMFSGKTEELLKRLDKIKYSKEKYIVFKPSIDTRSTTEIVSRWNNSNPATEIKKASDILEILKNTKEKFKVIAIDEVQFLDDDIIDVCQELTREGHHLILAGLDKNFKAKPFGCISKVLAIADSVTKLSASCTKCGVRATFSKRIIQDNNNEIYIGDKEVYEARCYQHYWNKD